eukprot:COSAG02_NODE_47163_length_343_cov_0.778689_1_plen_71_part_10
MGKEHRNTRRVSLTLAFHSLRFTPSEDLFPAWLLTCSPAACYRDPYLTSEYAEWYTKGMQQAPEDPYHIQA